MNHCFYCDKEKNENEAFHSVYFFHHDREREENLCSGCYQDWLDGMKQ